MALESRSSSLIDLLKHSTNTQEKSNDNTVLLSISVGGVPKPQGSKIGAISKSGRPFVRESCKGVREWRTRVADMAAAEFAGKPVYCGPVSLELEFHFVRPSSHFGTGKNSENLKKWAPLYKQTKPDLSKLVRAVEDSLTGIVYKDDAQIVHISACKVWGTFSGVQIIVKKR